MNSNQNTQRLHRQLFYENTFDQHFMPMETEESVYQAASAALSRLAQPFQKAWTPTGDVTFTAAPIQTYGLKLDVELDPDDIEASWVAFLKSNNHDRKEWPLVRWLLEEHLIPKFNEDIMLNEAYAGEFAAVTPGTAGAAGTAMNGVKKIINDHIDAGDITPIALGAMVTDPADFVTDLEDNFIEAIPEKYRTQRMTLIMNINLFNRFRKGQLAKYNTNYEQANQTQFMLFPNITVIGEPALGSSEKIWCTPMENQLVVWKYGSKMSDFHIESAKRQVHIYTDFRKGYGFLIPEIVFTNDLDLNTP